MKKTKTKSPIRLKNKMNSKIKTEIENNNEMTIR